MRVTYKVRFGKPAAKAERKKPPGVSRTARQLALAHHVERLIEDGVLKDYAEAARLLGITRARMTQVTNLLNLSPRVQEAIVTGTLMLSERELRDVVRRVEWGE